MRDFLELKRYFVVETDSYLAICLNLIGFYPHFGCISRRALFYVEQRKFKLNQILSGLRRRCSSDNSCKGYNNDFSLKKHKVLVQTCNKLPLGCYRQKIRNSRRIFKSIGHFLPNIQSPITSSLRSSPANWKALNDPLIAT